MEKRIRFDLPESEIPTEWYNIAPDLPVAPEPPLNPATKDPLGPDDLAAIFPPSLIEQEVSTKRYIEIPGEVIDVYRHWRPSPLFRARRLEKMLDSPARIYFKHEGTSPVGSHKPNTAVAQAYFNKKDGTKRLTTETGAGQWGSALSMASSFFDLDCTVFMVKVSYEQKPYRRSLMQVYGAEVFASPSSETEAGRAVLAQFPDSPGSLGMAISEAVEDAAKHDDTCYSLGSVLNHVLIHQSVIGLEAQRQMELADDTPDFLVGCVGGGSNFAGLSFPFIGEALRKGEDGPKPIAVEPAACPTLTRGRYAYDFGDSAGMTPLLKMHTLGHDFVPSGFHAGGLRYHGEAPLLSLLVENGLIEARSVDQLATFQAAVTFARAEGILPAPESAHAIRTVFDLVQQAREDGTEPAILMCLSGHGHFDLSAYDAYLAGELVDYTYPKSEIEAALSHLPVLEGRQ